MRQCPAVRISFILLSSAGGLFEGQRYVGPETTPAPLRPYGSLKLAQEQELLNCSAPLARTIVRLTSVYGYIRQGQRRGLIPTLICNGLKQQVSYIYGKMATLRDFVWIEDVVDHLADLLTAAALPGDSVTILAGDKPTSILEVQSLVERTLGRRIYLACLADTWNSEDITFSPAVCFRGRPGSDLRSTIRKIYQDAVDAACGLAHAGER